MASNCDPVSGNPRVENVGPFGRAAICINTDSSLLADVTCWMCMLPTDFVGPSQTDEKWLNFPQLSHSFPYAGQRSLLWRRGPPQYRHGAVVDFSLDLLSWANRTFLSMSVESLLLLYVERLIALIAWSLCWSDAACKREVSADLRIVITWSNVRASPISNSLMRTALSSTPEMTWPRMRVGSQLPQQS